MATRILQAHFDGNSIMLDEEFPLQPNTKLLIAVLDTHETYTEKETESNAEDDRTLWYRMSLQGLARAYGDDEPDYSLTQLKERNPDYEAG